MDRKVVWADAAVSDLESIAEYIARDSKVYAVAFVQRVLEATRSLADQPEMGRWVPELHRCDYPRKARFFIHMA